MILTGSLRGGGAARVALNLADLWGARNHEVVVMSTYSQGGSGSYYSVSKKTKIVYLVDICKSNNSFSRLVSLRKFIIRHEFTVVLSFLTHVNVAAIIASAGTKIPIVACERSDPFVMPLSLKWKIARSISYPFSDRVVIQTDELFQKFQRSFSTYKRKLTVIPNIIANNFMRDLKKKADSRRIVAVGRLSKEKQFDHLIIAFSKVQVKDNWVVEIFGEGAERASLQRLIESLGLEGQVFLRGAKRSIEDFLALGSIFCLTSRYEGFPNALLEAMYSGCAIVCYASPCGPTEMLNNGLNGILVDLNDISALADGLQKLILNDHLREDFGFASRRFAVEKYDAESILKKWQLLLNLGK